MVPENLLLPRNIILGIIDAREYTILRQEETMIQLKRDDGKPWSKEIMPAVLATEAAFNQLPSPEEFARMWHDVICPLSEVGQYSWESR